MKQKCMWFLFKLGLSLFTPDYMRGIGQKVLLLMPMELVKY